MIIIHFLAKKIDVKIKQKNLVDKSAIAGLKTNDDVDRKKATATFDSSYSRGKSHFEDDGTQNYLVFQTMYKYFEKIDNIDHISS